MIGGVETYTRLLAQGLGSRSGYDVTVATAAQGPSTLPGMIARIVRVPTLPELWKLIRRSDVVLLAGPSLVPLALALLSRRPVFIEHHGYQACCPNGLLLFQPEQSVCPERYRRGDVRSCLKCNWKTMGPIGSVASLVSTALRRLMCHHASQNICVSQHVSKRLNLRNCRVIYHGLTAVENARCQDAPIRNERPIVFAYVGRLTGEKGLPMLLAAASLLKAAAEDFQLRIIGDGPERIKIEKLAQRLNLSDKLVMTGLLSGESLQLALDDVSVVVMPSIWEETAGLAALEQMTRGRTVIVADIGGLSEIVGDAGLKYQPGDIVGLADQMWQILDNTAILETYGERARTRASQLFRHDQMVESHICAFNTVARRGIFS